MMNPPSPLGRFGEPATLILLSLAEGPKHGYSIMTDVQASFGLELGAGTLYAALSRLLKANLIEALPTEGRTRPYRITEGGRAEAAEFLRRWAPVIRVGQERLA